MDPATTAVFFPNVFNIKFIVLEGRGRVGRVCLRSLLQ